MATRQHRLSEFNDGPPPPDLPLQLLCEDHNGTYLLPYACRWQDAVWRKGMSRSMLKFEGRRCSP